MSELPPHAPAEADEKPQAAADESAAKISKLEEQLKAEQQKYVYLYAEFDNYKKRIAREREELIKYEGKEFEQLTLGFDDDDKRQLESNMRAWRTRLEQFELDLELEPRRIRDFYEVRARRVEPIGLVYLWPETN